MKSLSATTSTFRPPIEAVPAGRSGVRERPCAPISSDGDARSPTPLTQAFLQHDSSARSPCAETPRATQQKPAKVEQTDAGKNDRAGDDVIVDRTRHDHGARKTKASEQSKHHSRNEHFRGEHQKADDDQNDNCFKRTHGSSKIAISQQRTSRYLIDPHLLRSNGALAGEKFLNRSDGAERRVLHPIGNASERSADPADERRRRFGPVPSH